MLTEEEAPGGRVRGGKLRGGGRAEAQGPLHTTAGGWLHSECDGQPLGRVGSGDSIWSKDRSCCYLSGLNRTRGKAGGPVTKATGRGWCPGLVGSTEDGKKELEGHEVSWPFADELNVDCRRRKNDQDDSKFKDLSN